MKPLWKVEGFFNRTSWKVSDVQIVHFTWVFVSVSVSLCLCVLRVVSLSWWSWLLFVVEEVRERGGRGETKRTIRLLIPAKVFPQEYLKLNSFYQVKQMIGGIGDMLFSIHSQTENVKDLRVSLVNLCVAK